MAEKRIPKRSEVNVENTWNLADMFETDEKWFEEYEALGKLTEKIAAFEGTLGSGASRLLEYFRLEDELDERMERFFCYASCKGDEDVSNGFYQDMNGKAMGVMVALSSASAFASPEIMAIPDETMDAFYKECPELERYRRNIYKIRRKKAHILSKEEETLLASAREMASAAADIGGVFRNADLKWPEVKDADGNAHPLTNGSLTSLLESSDVDFRKRVFDTYYDRLGQFKNTIASTLDYQFKQLNFFARAGKYGSTLEASLDRTEVPVDVYHNLIEAVHQNMDKMYHYVRVRKKMMGLDELHMYDVYAPIVPDVASEVTLDEAEKTILEALSVLGNDYTDLLKEGFRNRWMDVYENEGKRSGAYSTGGYPHPYVLCNYKGNLDSMFTIAHEMGHSLHTYYSVKNQPVNTAGYVIFVAEVASTCNEILLVKHLLNKTTDRKVKAYLINHFLDSFKGTVYRQTMFAEFELEMGRMNERGEALTADALCAKYHELNKLYFGPDMISDDGIALEWARIPHFFYNYYVFQYATGFSAAVAIANRILEEGEPAVADYKRFLSSGSSSDPISLLKIAGVDMSTPDPVNSALKLFGELVDELEALAE